MTLLQHHILALALTALTVASLGLLVFLADPKRRLNQIFGLYSLSISGWAFTECFIAGAVTQADANIWSYLTWPPIIFIAPTFLHTILLSTEGKIRRNTLLKISYFLALTFLLLHLFTHTVTASTRPVGYVRFHSRLTPFGWLMPGSFLVFVNITLWKLWQAYKEATGQHRIQLKYLFWSSLLGYLGGSPNWFFTMGFHVPYLSPFGIYCVSMYSLATTYAVLQHRLFDVNLVIRRSLAYSILITALTVGYFGLIYGVERLFQLTVGYSSPWLSLAAFALMALAFQPLKSRIQRLVDLLIFRMPQEMVAKKMERLEEQVLHAEKFKAVSTLAAGMAHEIKNPLTAIKAFTEFLPERHNEPEFIRHCHEVLAREVNRIQGLVQDVLDFAKPRAPQFKPVEADKLIRSTLDLLSGELIKHRVRWTVDCRHDGAVLQADPDQLRQVLINLIQNAADAMPDGGTLTLATRTAEGHLELTLSDTGCGIPAELLPKIFDPFVSGKANGNGLGLAVVYSIVQSHHGTIRADSRPGRGTTFTLRFPL